MFSVLDPIYLFISTDRQGRRVWVFISPFTVGEMKCQMLSNLLGGGSLFSSRFWDCQFKLHKTGSGEGSPDRVTAW